MLQWMGGSRRKVATSRGSTQKRQKQYFEQRRRQQQQQTSGSENYLEENVCSTSPSTSNNERRSLDVLSLKTLSTVAQECSPRCQSAINADGNKPESIVPRPIVLSLSGNPGKDSVQFASEKEEICDPSCSNEMNTSNANLDPWKNEVSILDILEDDDLKYNLRENPMSEDHVSFSVGGLGKVGTETPSPPHRMGPHGGLLCSKASRGVEMSKNPLNDIELDVESVLQDIDTSLSGKSSKFSSYSMGQVETFEKRKPKMFFPVDDIGFDNFDRSFGGNVRGKRANDNKDYKENIYPAHPNFMVDNFFNVAQRDLPWEHRPRRETMSDDCWESGTLEENSFKRPHFFSERDTEIPMDSFNFTDTEFTTFHTPGKSINFKEALPRSPSQKMSFRTVDMPHNPNQFYSPLEDPKDSPMSSEESCSSSAVRRDIMDSVAKKSEINDNIWSPKGLGKCFHREETLPGHRNYVQKGKTAVGTVADTDKFDTSNLPSEMPSRLTVDNKLKAKDCWFGTREKPKSEVDSGLTSFYIQSKTKSEAYENEPWAEGFTSAFADSKLGDRPKLDGRKSIYTPESAPCTPFFLESYDSPWNACLTSKSEAKCIPMSSLGVIESPENCKLPPSVSGYAKKDQKMAMGNPLANALDCKLRKQKIDFIAMGIVQIRDKEGCGFKSDWENLKVPSPMQYPEFPEAMNSSAVITSDKFLITDDENENHHKEDSVSDISANGSKDAETAVADYKEQRTVTLKNTASPLDRVLKHQRYFVQFMCVQQTSVEKAKEI